MKSADPRVVAFIESLLAAAKAGEIDGLAVILPREGNVQVLINGAAEPAELYFGAGILQRQLIDAAAARRSSILPVRG